MTIVLNTPLFLHVTRKLLPAFSRSSLGLASRVTMATSHLCVSTEVLHCSLATAQRHSRATIMRSTLATQNSTRSCIE